MLSLNIIILSACTTLIDAFPGSDREAFTGLETRCGSLLTPDALFLLDEYRPDTYLPINDSLFQTSQKVGKSGDHATGRQYVLAHFLPTPYNSYGCELHWNIPENTTFRSDYGGHQLDVKLTTAYAEPFVPTWTSVIAGNAPILGPGVFGSVNAVAGANVLVNTATCSNRAPPGVAGMGMGLGIVFKFAAWVEQAGGPAGISFYSGWTGPAGVFTGPYLRYNC